ncbi:MAG TPA: hypothetical protein PK605_10180 [Ignavibacteria bacterium]|mgnify:CR=1 FL=1|nr:hypothetical protein [Ignavibacteria bacterium]HRE10577.1 hypothetical protein [Ignavibacteria bacterium]HRF64864.1 hypothetical protein [Ignavibacteria bacterium]HRJ04756.1 hypothetical protein [Ignavibacteria bacterium]HRJ85124.1 hypothetical protein [Ignavibacteria bacterium]
MKKLYKPIIGTFLVLFAFMNFGCSGVMDAITNVQRLQFKLDKVTGMKVANVSLSNFTSISSIGVIDAANLLAAFTQGKLPVEFTLNVLAKNPNDGTGGTKQSSAVIENLAWRLFIDSKETINGNVGNISVPGVGQSTNIPILMSFDLLKFFSNGQYNDLINLALALGGKSGSSSRVTLKVKPTVSTILGPITYPGEFDVVDTEFRGGN